MFVVLLRYLVPLEKIEALLPEHVAFLDRHYADGTFLVSGRKVPRTGGVILARGESEESLRRILAEDPFSREGAATYDVVQFQPTRTAEGLAPFFT